MLLREIALAGLHIETGYSTFEPRLPLAQAALWGSEIMLSLQVTAPAITEADERAILAEVERDGEQFLAELRALRERNLALAMGDAAVTPEPDLDSGGVGPIWGANSTPVSDKEWEARRIEAARKLAMPWLPRGGSQKRR